MAVSRDRFSFALEMLKPSDWERFETLASTFLASEISGIRTMASPSGDGGRDSELFEASDRPRTAIQYSVTEDWNGKIRKTQARLESAFPDTRVLIYVTSQIIGARADALKAEMGKKGVFLDILDRNWFLERVNIDKNRASSAEEIIRQVADPILADIGSSARSPGTALSTRESRTALVYLEMQRMDEDGSKSLTRSSFEALVKAALAGTSSEGPISIASLYERVAAFLTRYEISTLRPYIDAAVKRMSGRQVSVNQANNTIHISFPEAERLKDSAAKIARLHGEFENDIRDIARHAEGVEILDDASLFSIVKSVIEASFIRRGEEFANAVIQDQAAPPVDSREISTLVAQHAKKDVVRGREPISFLSHVVVTLLAQPSDATREYLRMLSDGYTLMAFLEETPDVQAVTNKLFSQGRIWLDTSVLLPIFAEQATEGTPRPFTALFQQASTAGAKLYVSPGIVEEIERHLNRCLAYARSQSWEGDIPYVYAKFILAGNKRAAFPNWVEYFVGNINPEQDIADYLNDEFGILLENPSTPDDLPRDIVQGVERYWQEIHERRRGLNDAFNMNLDRLARHDAENYLGVLIDRSANHGRAGIGRSTWWLTLDRAALRLPTDIDRSVWEKIKFSPVMSLDFLLKYFAFGPARDRVTAAERSAASVFAPALLEAVPSDVLEAALLIRESNSQLPERIIQRRIRDQLDVAKSSAGPAHRAGLESIDDEIEKFF